MVPFEPSEPPAVRRKAGRGEEVRARHERHGRTIPVEWHGDDGGAGLPFTLVVLADGEDAASAKIDPEVRVAHRALGGDRDRRLSFRIQPIEAAVGEVREDDDAARHGVRATAVFVDAAPDVEWRRRKVARRPVGGRPHEDSPSAFDRTRLQPVRLVAVDPRFRETDDVADHIVDADRRRPRAVRRDDRIGHGQVPCCQDATYSACSGVMASRLMPSAASLRRATSASIASGTT